MALRLKMKTQINFQSIFNDPVFYDVIVKSSEGTEFKLHSIVLTQNSKYFKNMLTADWMKQEKKDPIALNESTKILQDLFGLMYEKDSEGDYKHFMDLATASKKYEMEGINKSCVETLMTAIDGENAVELLIFAEKENFHELYTRVLNCINFNLDTIRNSESWNLMIDHPNLLNDVLNEYVDRVEMEMKKIKVEAQVKNDAAKCSKPIFSTAARRVAQPLNAPSTSIFGQPRPSTTSTSIFGQPNTTSTPIFGQPSTPASNASGIFTNAANDPFFNVQPFSSIFGSTPPPRYNSGSFNLRDTT